MEDCQNKSIPQRNKHFLRLQKLEHLCKGQICQYFYAKKYYSSYKISIIYIYIMQYCDA